MQPKATLITRKTKLTEQVSKRYQSASPWTVQPKNRLETLRIFRATIKPVPQVHPSQSQISTSIRAHLGMTLSLPIRIADRSPEKEMNSKANRVHPAYLSTVRESSLALIRSPFSERS